MTIGLRIERWVLLVLSLTAFVFLSGCGGGAGNAAGSGLSVFFTDDFSDDYDQVWVRVHQVDVVGAGGSTTVFQSEEGEVIDLASLNDGAPRFAFMGAGVVSGPQTVRVSLGSQLSLVPAGGSDAVSAEFLQTPIGGALDRTVIELSVEASQITDSVVVDFDLSQWSIIDGYVNPIVRLGSLDGLDNDDRHEERSVPGVVGGLSGELPDQSFTLGTHNAHSIVVTTTADTVIYGPTGGAAQLANGQHVMVSGKYSPSIGGIVASEIEIAGDNEHEQRILGEAFDANFESSTFLVELKGVRGFVPDHRIVTVVTPEGTQYLSPSGEEISKARFYEAISSNDKKIVAEGLYDHSTNSFEASVVKLHHEHDERHRVETAGEIVHIDREHHAFALAWREWHGGPEPDSDVVRVMTSDRTEFFNPEGVPIRPEVFFSEVEPGAIVEVDGLFGDGVLRAFRVKVRHWGGGTDHHVAFGEVQSVHPDLWKFKLAVIESHGILSNTHVIPVFVSEDAQIVDREGNEFTREQFFSEIEPGGKVTVHGLFDGEQMAARKIVVHRWGDDDRPARVVGTAVEWNVLEGRFWLSLIEWSGFEANPGDEIKIQTQENTVYKNQAGVTLSKEQFFDELTTDSIVLVEGEYHDSYVEALFCKLLE